MAVKKDGTRMYTAQNKDKKKRYNDSQHCQYTACTNTNVFNLTKLHIKQPPLQPLQHLVRHVGHVLRKGAAKQRRGSHWANALQRSECLATSGYKWDVPWWTLDPSNPSYMER